MSHRGESSKSAAEHRSRAVARERYLRGHREAPPPPPHWPPLLTPPPHDPLPPHHSLSPSPSLLIAPLPPLTPPPPLLPSLLPADGCLGGAGKHGRRFTPQHENKLAVTRGGRVSSYFFAKLCTVSGASPRSLGAPLGLSCAVLPLSLLLSLSSLLSHSFSSSYRPYPIAY